MCCAALLNESAEIPSYYNRTKISSMRLFHKYNPWFIHGFVKCLIIIYLFFYFSSYDKIQIWWYEKEERVWDIRKWNKIGARYNRWRRSQHSDSRINCQRCLLQVPVSSAGRWGRLKGCCCISTLPLIRISYICYGVKGCRGRTCQQTELTK